MLISYKWLQSYFDEPLPSAEELAGILTTRVFEIDGLEKKDQDTILDIKVLPDRAHYCLSHRGIAGEVAAALGRQTTQKHGPIEPYLKMVSDTLFSDVAKPSIAVEDSARCPRYTARLMEHISVAPSPDWLREKLLSIGQRSINNIVDAANLVMFDMGQPLHAFDADKVAGGITVRLARVGERIATLDGKDVPLTPETLVIADNEGPLAIAGIKGGTRAEVTAATTRIILESANFHPGLIRNTSTSLGIRTDASKRFENGITPEYTMEALEEVTAVVLETSPDAKAGETTDVYPQPVKQTELTVNLKNINKVLGIEVPCEEVTRILNSLKIVVAGDGDEVHLTIPFERLDLAIPEDIAEEIGRLYGYDKLPDALPPGGVTPVIDKRHYYVEKIRDILKNLGFSEAYLYSLVAEGDFEVALPLAEDKKGLRTTLVPGMTEALKMNARNAPLFGLDQIKLFEFGNVFPRSGETLCIAVGIENAAGYKKTKANEDVQEAVGSLLDMLGISRDAMKYFNIRENIIEWSFDEFFKHLPEVTIRGEYEITPEVRYRKFSPYPFVLRDIAVWVPESATAEELLETIKAETGDLLVTHKLFDEYKKDGRVSYAYRLVLQSMEKTLTDEEVNKVMNKISATVKEKGWEVR